MKKLTTNLSMIGISIEQSQAVKKILENLNEALNLGASIVETSEVSDDEAKSKVKNAKKFIGVADHITATDEEIKEVRALTRLRI